ncbi:MAG: hydrogenase formation protein HypD [Lentisphaerae bacterium]|nr:hydrogenase formation protein HypD [Lentisphaerota bacterium]
MSSAVDILRNYSGRKLRIMEVCGTHTHEIFRLGIRSLLSENIELVSGPGCPVCVTPPGFIDSAIELATRHKAIITTFGDLIRVPGSNSSLAGVRKDGAVVKAVYSPLDALDIARSNPDQEVVFLAVGFETTTPSACIAVKKAREENLKNFSILTANKTMPQAYKALQGSADAFLYPGHVHAIIGTGLCEDLTREGVSGVVAGFTAELLVKALSMIVEMSQSGVPFFANAYSSIVKSQGNLAAQKLIADMMQPCDCVWRGLGEIKQSGMALKDEFAGFDAVKKFKLVPGEGRTNPGCRCGEVLRGNCKPCDCPLFGKVCDPLHPVGACMVSGEGACSAFYQYAR